MPFNESVLTSVRSAATLIKGSRYITALTGAGVSVESGIRPFRGLGGLWTERGEPSMDGYRRFEADPKRYWEEMLSPERKGAFKESMQSAKPNIGHYAFAELEAMGILKSLITQNIDNLHNEAGSKNVHEIHGNRHKLRCIRCEARFQWKGFDISTLPPRCPKCGGVVKDDVVMFGEPIPRGVLASCQTEAARCDCMIVAGTSAVVYPAAGLPLTVKEGGGVIIEVNPLKSELSEISDAVIRTASGEALPALVEALRLG